MRDLVGICGLGMTNVSLSLTHHHLYQPGASEQLGASQLSIVSDLSWSLARHECCIRRLPLACGAMGCCLQGLRTPLGDSHAAAPIRTVHC